MSLKERLKSSEILVAPGVYDGLTAAIAAEAGFEALYLSGAAVAYTRLGRPDIGLTSVTEMTETMALIRDRVDLPVIVDADTGFGNALNAQRTMRFYERTGASALQVEDQTFPKRCGHLSDKSLIPKGEMVGKIAAMADARASEETLIVARTDAVAVEGFDAALERANEWLAERFELPFSVVTDFDYPGHSRRRMHGLPTRSGQELVDRLRTACEAEAIDIVCNRRAVTLFRDGERITGVEVEGPDGTERIGCGTLVLACNGFGGNRDMVAAHMPDIEGAVWFGHDGNKGDAVHWGQALGTETLHLGAYQGHGNVATPHGILISWAVITSGGIQVNTDGRRFWDESQGYSEAARAVLAQPGGVAWAIFDARIAEIARQFQDFKDAEQVGAVLSAGSITELAETCGLPVDALKKTFGSIPKGGIDEFSRTFTEPSLEPPFMAVKVTGALFHTQGGLSVTSDARVKLKDGTITPNLFAAGGAAVGVSGSGDRGYLSGNGLLAAVVLGRIAGQHAAQQTRMELTDA